MLSSEEKRLLLERLKDPMWRLSNLYEIKLTDGRVIRYEPREHFCFRNMPPTRIGPIKTYNENFKSLV